MCAGPVGLVLDGGSGRQRDLQDPSRTQCHQDTHKEQQGPINGSQYCGSSHGHVPGGHNSPSTCTASSEWSPARSKLYKPAASPHADAQEQSASGSGWHIPSPALRALAEDVQRPEDLVQAAISHNKIESTYQVSHKSTVAGLGHRRDLGEVRQLGDAPQSHSPAGWRASSEEKDVFIDVGATMFNETVFVSTASTEDEPLGEPTVSQNEACSRDASEPHKTFTF